MNPISLEQRGKVQVSIDFLKRDMWSKYTDGEEIRTLVIGNVNHIESYITKLSASEQAWREENESLKLNCSVYHGAMELANKGFVDREDEVEKLREQLEQTMKLLKQSHTALIPCCSTMVNRKHCLCQSCIAVLSIDKFLSQAEKG